MTKKYLKSISYQRFFGSLSLSALLLAPAFANSTPEKLNIYSLSGTCQLFGQCKNVSTNSVSGRIYYITNAGYYGTDDNISWSHGYLSGGGGGSGDYYFHIDAKQNDLIFGKRSINGTETGTIKLNSSGANVYSSIEVKANNIYIGGNIIMAHDSTGFKLGFNAIGDIVSNANFDVRGTTSGLAAGVLIFSGKSLSQIGTINLNGDSTHNGQTLNVEKITEKVSISSLTATRGNIYANTDFNIENLTIKTANFNPTTDFYGKNDTAYKITNLEIFGGWGATTKATAKFNSGKSLAISTAKISKRSTLDASAISDVSIDTLESSYATIKAGSNLTINKATFSNNKTFLYANSANGKINIGDITFENEAKLYIKSGDTLTAKNLTMKSQSVLFAQSGNKDYDKNGNMNADTMIDKILFDQSELYVNNLTTQEITIKNNANIYLKDSNFINNGDLNISDGSKLTVYNGNMINNGSLNFTLNPNNTELIDVEDGYFQFNMDASDKTQQFPITNIDKNGNKIEQVITVGIPKSKVNIYTSTKDLITGVTYKLVKANGGIQFKKNDKIYSLNDNTGEYGTLNQLFAQNIYFYDNQNNNSPLAVNFTSSTSDNTLSFVIQGTGVYVDTTPYIKPGTWVFGIGNGNAIFGIMNGAGGLARDYTLTLEPKVSDEEVTKGQEVIYYLKDYTYHNSGNTSAVFTIDATGSKFILGKNRDTAGEVGNISIGDALAKSTMHVKADDIYLGGTITLGDGLLISGHLKLETTKKEGLSFIGSNDNNHESTINVRNHSSLTAIGDTFDYQGTINLTGNGTVSDEVTLDLSKITGNNKIKISNSDGTTTDTNYGIYIHKLVVRDARKNSLGGGISAKNFLINTMEVRSSNNSYNEFLTDIGDSKINTLHFIGGTSGADASTLNFRGGGNLEVDTLTLDNYGRIDVSNLATFKINDSLSAVNSIITLSHQSQEVDFKKILQFKNTTLNTSHFSSYGLNISSGASFYQSKDDQNGFADITLTGTYSIQSGFFNVGTKNITFTNLNNAKIENLSASTWGAYGGNLVFKNVKNISIDSLTLAWNSSADVSYPTFDTTGSENANITISSLEATGGIIKVASNTQLDIKNITNITKTTLLTSHFSSSNFNTSSGASFYQSKDDQNSFADITLTGTYSIQSGFSDVGTKNITFTNLNNAKIENLSASTWGAYGGNLVFKNVKNISIDSLTLAWNSSADVSYPTFDTTGSENANIAISSLEATGGIIKTANSGSMMLTNAIFTNTTANFYNLYLAHGGQLTYNESSQIIVNGNLEIKGTINFLVNANTFSPIQVSGKTDIYFDATQMSNENYQSIFNVYNLKGIKVGETYTLLDSTGGITYHYTDQNGKVSSGTDKGFQANMLDRIGFFATQGDTNRLDKDTAFIYNGIGIEKFVTSNSIGFKIISSNDSNINPYDKNRIEYWFYRKGGKEWIDAINATGSNVMDFFQTLMLDKNNVFFANDVITGNNLDYFIKVAKKIESASDQIHSASRKSSTIDILRLATDTNKNNRLVKLSSTQSTQDERTAFMRAIQAFKQQRFASADKIDSAESETKTDISTENDTTFDLAQAYTQAIRDTYKNNVWATAIGAANFVQNGNGALYGIDLGYDRSFRVNDNRVIVGGYLAYAYSTYYGDLIQNYANNLNFGLYVRSFIPHGEIDFSASQTIGFNQESIDSQEIITRQINQNYSYQSYITNINLNYGYLFYMQDKSFVLKPQVGLNYFLIANSSIQGKNSNSFYGDILAQANADQKHVLTLDVAIEARKYLNEGSYWFFNGGISQDLFITSQGDETIRFINQDILAYQKGDALNLHFKLSIGGEMEIFKRTYLNLSLGSKFGVFYKDIGINGNIGLRYIF